MRYLPQDGVIVGTLWRDRGASTRRLSTTSSDDWLRMCRWAALTKFAFKFLSRCRLLCSVCQAVRYCGPACQKIHWKSTHKSACAKLSSLPARPRWTPVRLPPLARLPPVAVEQARACIDKLREDLLSVLERLGRESEYYARACADPRSAATADFVVEAIDSAREEGLAVAAAHRQVTIDAMRVRSRRLALDCASLALVHGLSPNAMGKNDGSSLVAAAVACREGAVFRGGGLAPARWRARGRRRIAGS